MKKSVNNSFSIYGIDSGEGLKRFLDNCGLSTRGMALDSSQNVIHLPDNITFNWKKSKGQVHVSCKEEAMSILEQRTDLKHIDNGAGDPTHQYSFLIDDLGDLIDVIYVLRHFTG